MVKKETLTPPTLVSACLLPNHLSAPYLLVNPDTIRGNLVIPADYFPVRAMVNVLSMRRIYMLLSVPTPYHPSTLMFSNRYLTEYPA
jgi:hypothetical protein